MILLGILTVRRGIKQTESIPTVPVLEKDTVLCDYLNKNDRRLLIIGNVCFLYRLYEAKPDCRYLFQRPIAEIFPDIWETVFEEVRNKKTPLILIPKKHNAKIPDYFLAFLQDNYKQMDCLQGILFVSNDAEKQL